MGMVMLVVLAFAASGPWLAANAEPARVVVLDASPSMGARLTPDGASRFDLARRTAQAVLREASASPFRALLIAGERTHRIVAAPGDDGPFEQALLGAAVSEGSCSLGAIASAAAALVGAQGGGTVVVISDFAGREPFVVPSTDGRVVFETITAGSPAPNAGVTSIVASPFTSRAGTRDMTATVRNASPSKAELTLTSVVDAVIGIGTSLRLDPDETATWQLAVSGGGSRLFEVRVSPGGALAADDAARIRLPGPFHLTLRSEREPGPALMAALAAIDGTPASRGEEGIVVLFSEKVPGDLPPRWIYLRTRSSAIATSSAPPVALDLLESASGVLDPADLILVDPAALPPLQPPEGSIPIALAQGRPAVALVDRAGSRGVWWGVSIEATSLPEGDLLPLVLVRGLRWLEGAESSDASTFEQADLTPRPPGGARDALAVLGDARPSPLPARALLLWSTLGLAALEMARRWAAARGRRHGAPSSAVGLPTIAAGEGR